MIIVRFKTSNTPISNAVINNWLDPDKRWKVAKGWYSSFCFQNNSGRHCIHLSTIFRKTGISKIWLMGHWRSDDCRCEVPPKGVSQRSSRASDVLNISWSFKKKDRNPLHWVRNSSTASVRARICVASSGRTMNICGMSWCLTDQQAWTADAWWGFPGGSRLSSGWWNVFWREFPFATNPNLETDTFGFFQVRQRILSVANRSCFPIQSIIFLGCLKISSDRPDKNVAEKVIGVLNYCQRRSGWSRCSKVHSV